MPPPPAYYAAAGQQPLLQPGGTAAAPAPVPGMGANPAQPGPFPGMPGNGLLPNPGMPGAGMPGGGLPHPPRPPMMAPPPAPTYVPPIPFPSEAELLSRPPPLTNCDPFDETYPTYNVFVGDMPPDITDADLYAAFQPAGAIHSVNVVRDKYSGLAKGYGFVNLLSSSAQQYALDHLRSVVVPRTGAPIRCFPSDSKTQLQVINLPPNWTPAQLKQELERIGGPMIGEPQVTRPGQALLNYINYRRAEKALALISGKPCGPAPVVGTPLMGASLAPSAKPAAKVPTAPGAPRAPPATLFIKNICATVTEDALAKYFLKQAPSIHVVKSTIVRDNLTGESKGFGFIEVANEDEMRTAQQAVHQCVLDGKVLSVEYAKIPGGPQPGPGAAPGPGARAPPPPAPTRTPRSRHQNEGDGGFTNPRGFSDAMTESKQSGSVRAQGGPLTIYDDDWHTGNVPAAAAIAHFHVAPKAGPIMREGKMVGWGYPGVDEAKIGQVAPPQGSLESKCSVQRAQQAGQISGQLATYELSSYYGGVPPQGFVPMGHRGF